jgi:uncharacterized protein YndB with AHSA1/START domain
MSQTYKATLTTPTDRDIEITRVFNAPRRLVFEAMTQPEHIRHWYGLRADTMTVCEFDARVGGQWRFVTVGEDGVDIGFSGEVRELSPYDRLAYTEEFEMMPGHASLVTATFTEAGGKTTMHMQVRYESQADRDAVIASGMEYGMNETYDRLDEHLATMKTAA